MQIGKRIRSPCRRVAVRQLAPITCGCRRSLRASPASIPGHAVLGREAVLAADRCKMSSTTPRAARVIGGRSTIRSDDERGSDVAAPWVSAGTGWRYVGCGIRAGVSSSAMSSIHPGHRCRFQVGGPHDASASRTGRRQSALSSSRPS